MVIVNEEVQEPVVVRVLIKNKHNTQEFKPHDQIHKEITRIYARYLLLLEIFPGALHPLEGPFLRKATRDRDRGTHWI